MIPRRTFTFIAAAATLALAACSSGNPGGQGYAGNPMGNSVRIFVTNLNFMEATVYGVTTGSRRKLGIVPGKGEEVLTMRISFPTELHLEIDIMAGPYCFTDRLTVDGGDEFELFIQQAGANLNCRLQP
jgi:hypothetical protein